MPDPTTDAKVAYLRALGYADAADAMTRRKKATTRLDQLADLDAQAQQAAMKVREVEVEMRDAQARDAELNEARIEAFASGDETEAGRLQTERYQLHETLDDLSARLAGARRAADRARIERDTFIVEHTPNWWASGCPPRRPRSSRSSRPRTHSPMPSARGTPRSKNSSGCCARCPVTTAARSPTSGRSTGSAATSAVPSTRCPTRCRACTPRKPTASRSPRPRTRSRWRQSAGGGGTVEFVEVTT
jgi:hypothetical protein